MFFVRHNFPKGSCTARVGLGALLGIAACAFIVPNANAGEWTINPQISVEQSFTDNARSVSEGLEADIITSTTAGIDVSGVGRRAQLNFNYNISRDAFWDNTELGGFRQSLLGSGNVEAVEDFVFIDTRASVSQQSLQRGGGVSASDRTVGTNDQSTVLNYSITPNFEHRYGSWADTDVRYTFNETRFFDPDVGTAGAQPDASRTHTIQTLLRSGPKFTQLSWELSGTRTFTDNGSNRNLTELSGEYAWTRHLTLIGRAGSETIDGSGINADDSAELFWLGGVRITPGPKSSFRIETGRRFASTSFSADASYRFSSRTALTASYKEDVQTERQELAANLDSLVLSDDGILIDPATGLPGSPNSFDLDFLDRVNKSKTFNIALNGTRGRNSFNLNGTVNIRSQEPEGTEDVVVGFGGGINRRIWPDLNGGISANINIITEAANGIEEYTFTSNAFLSYSISENFTGSLRYDFLRRDSDADASDLQENVLSVSLNKTF